jgi:4-amino-4-deoxy-L-arabinose transferase-like glycosyltransferase
MEDRQRELTVLAIAAAIFLGCIIAPPHLMDDVDAVQAQIARNMLESGDWVTARLDGVPYLEKSPLVYWMMALSFAVFGVHDWAARLPIALSVVALCWVTYRFGRWAFGSLAGFYAGLSLSTCIGLWLFTRILIPDVTLTLTITVALWAMLRALEGERHWAHVMAASIGVGLLLKGLIAVLFPVAAGLIFLVLTKSDWRKLRPFSGAAIVLLIAVPWHILATLSNPPYLEFTMHSGPGEYRGFFWFYFFNEHILRFLNMRYPRDYNTVPRYLFWLFHLLWFFPWSGFLPDLIKLKYFGAERAERTRLLALCWLGFILIFFTFSTTQEYYSMPAYPAFALLLGCAMAAGARSRTTAAVAALACVAATALLIRVWGLPAPGDISRSLTQNPDLYTLSLGHMGDLTIDSFAYLRMPLAIAAAAFLLGAVATWRRSYVGMALMMVVFLQAARLAMVTFDPYMSSKELADALNQAPEGQVVVDNQYYAFSSVFFYTNMQALLLNGRVNNLEYGSYAPGAPQVFLTDAQFPALWRGAERTYLFLEKPRLAALETLVGRESLHVLKESGGKYLLVNQQP